MHVVKWVASLLSIYLSFRFADAMRKQEPFGDQVLKILVVVAIVTWLIVTETRGGASP